MHATADLRTNHAQELPAPPTAYVIHTSDAPGLPIVGGRTDATLLSCEADRYKKCKRLRQPRPQMASFGSARRFLRANFRRGTELRRGLFRVQRELP